VPGQARRHLSVLPATLARHRTSDSAALTVVESLAIPEGETGHDHRMTDAVHIAPVGRVPADVALWLEGDEPIMLRAATGTDPVELTAKDARDLAAALLELASKVSE
jgi:hypothetical protein